MAKLRYCSASKKGKKGQLPTATTKNKKPGEGSKGSESITKPTQEAIIGLGSGRYPGQIRVWLADAGKGLTAENITELTELQSKLQTGGSWRGKGLGNDLVVFGEGACPIRLFATVVASSAAAVDVVVWSLFRYDHKTYDGQLTGYRGKGRSIPWATACYESWKSDAPLRLLTTDEGNIPRMHVQSKTLV
ncbi:hypothetical protein L211DRAFT_850518 [Terfezia boudieri ATCC MYA-4762]|uniref:Uncharacterized protein n=1 Tax=Terfezia boudieri ATCC MYA-4762 TaxID=1051890 RepID=A0A3N4LHV2_9PEZI|nr:hypothetical protein L211DRAFT_850518 [Terfezia boudieri ATCC MYA-4762]